MSDELVELIVQSMADNARRLCEEIERRAEEELFPPPGIKPNPKAWEAAVRWDREHSGASRE